MVGGDGVEVAAKAGLGGALGMDADAEHVLAAVGARGIDQASLELAADRARLASGDAHLSDGGVGGLASFGGRSSEERGADGYGLLQL